MLFRKNIDKKPEEQKNIFSLTGNNYNSDKLNLLKHQLSHYMEIFFNKNMKKFKFCHIYASGEVDHGGYPGQYVLKLPTFKLSFGYKEGSLNYNDITKLFHSKYSKFLGIETEIKHGLCLAISVEMLSEFQLVVEKLNVIGKDHIPPIIIFANEACYTDVSDLADKIDLGIATIIKTYKYGANFQPMNLYYMSTPAISCDQYNDVWKQLTVAIELLISQSRQFLKEEVDQALVFQPTDVNNIIVDYAIPKRAF